MIKTINPLSWGVGLVGLMIANAATASSASDCSDLLQLSSLYNGHVTSVEYIPQGPAAQDPNSAMTGASTNEVILPEHCKVQGVLDERTTNDGTVFGTRFEIRLPTQWEGRFLFQGGGGLDGFLADAYGRAPTSGSSAAPALMRNYAVVAMNGGHDGMDARFASDQKARLDYAYAAIGKVTQAAKTIVDTYYGHKPVYSYFMGCSNGGREALLAAQRYSDEFNGVVVGNPGFRLSRAALAEAWDTQQFMSVAPVDQNGNKVLANALMPQDLTMLSQAIAKQCDKLDGLEDGIINNYMDCDFEPETISCDKTDASNCLAPEKVAVIKAIFNGAHDSNGNALYNSWPYDTGIADMGWRAWKLGFSQDGSKPDSLNVLLGADSLVNYFMTPPNPNFDMLDFDFDKDVVLLNETGALNDTTMSLMNSYMDKGGKVLIFQGLSDPVFSSNDIRDWYLKVQQNTSGNDSQRQREWMRLFMVPGMNHCGGGPALDDFDPLTALQNWVENGETPNYLAATGKAFPEKSQPICAYPETARYIDGNVNAIDSYRCE